MADIINLRRERKSRKRSEASRKAEQNRALHGQTKVERLHARERKEKSARELDGKQLGPKG